MGGGEEEGGGVVSLAGPGAIVTEIKPSFGAQEQTGAADSRVGNVRRKGRGKCVCVLGGGLEAARQCRTSRRTV